MCLKTLLSIVVCCAFSVNGQSYSQSCKKLYSKESLIIKECDQEVKFTRNGTSYVPKLDFTPSVAILTKSGVLVFAYEPGKYRHALIELPSLKVIWSSSDSYWGVDVESNKYFGGYNMDIVMGSRFLIDKKTGLSKVIGNNYPFFGDFDRINYLLIVNNNEFRLIDEEDHTISIQRYKSQCTNAEYSASDYASTQRRYVIKLTSRCGDIYLTNENGRNLTLSVKKPEISEEKYYIMKW